MAFRGETVDQNPKHVLGGSRCYNFGFKPVLIAETKDRVLLELSRDSKFSVCVGRAVIFSKLAGIFAGAGKPNVWCWKKTNITGSDGFTARIQNRVFVFVQWGSQTCGGRNERTT